MDDIISYKMCAVKVRNAKLRNYLKLTFSVSCRGVQLKFLAGIKKQYQLTRGESK